jgi:hypothetical protein
LLVIRPIITQPIVRPQLYHSTTIQPTVTEQPIIQPHIIHQTTITPKLVEQAVETAPVQAPGNKKTNINVYM